MMHTYEVYKGNNYGNKVVVMLEEQRGDYVKNTEEISRKLAVFYFITQGEEFKGFYYCYLSVI